MSLIIVTHIPEGIVMASDSRQSIILDIKAPDGTALPKLQTINSDSVYKTYLLSRLNELLSPVYEIGVSSFGKDLLGKTSTASHIKRFSEQELSSDDDISTVPQKLLNYFRSLFPDADTGFHIAGYKKENKISIPHVYNCHVSKNIIERRNVDNTGSVTYGATWSGQIDVLSGLIQPSVQLGPDGKPITIPKPPILWDAMSLQDAIDFSVFAIRTTIDAIRFQARPKDVGGPIDILVLTPDGANWINKKKLKP